MESSTILTRKSLPATGSPYHHKIVNSEIAQINTIIINSEMSEDDRRILVEAITKLTKTCVSDVVERLAI